MQVFSNTHPRFNDLLPPTSALWKLLESVPNFSGRGWLVGGALRRAISNRPIDSDLDFVFKSEADKNSFHADLEGEGFIQSAATGIKSNTNWTHPKLEKIPLQSIHHRYYDDVTAIFDSFDFTICQFAYADNTLYCGEMALYDLAMKRLVVNKISYPTASLRRIIKYSKQDFYLCAGAASNFLKQIVDNPTTVLNQTIISMD